MIWQDGWAPAERGICRAEADRAAAAASPAQGEHVGIFRTLMTPHIQMIPSSNVANQLNACECVEARLRVTVIIHV